MLNTSRDGFAESEEEILKQSSTTNRRCKAGSNNITNIHVSTLSRLLTYCAAVNYVNKQLKIMLNIRAKKCIIQCTICSVNATVIVYETVYMFYASLMDSFSSVNFVCDLGFPHRTKKTMCNQIRQFVLILRI